MINQISENIDEISYRLNILQDNVKFLKEPKNDFSEIDPKEYIQWLFNEDTENNKERLIEELYYWNK